MRLNKPPVIHTLRRYGAAVLASACIATPPANAAEHELVTDHTTPAQQAAQSALLQSALLQSTNRDDFYRGRYAGPDGALPYRLLSPAKVEPGQRYPLVIVLHGSGAVGDDNNSQLGQLAMSWAAPAIRQRYPAYVLVPQFAERSANYAPSAVDGLLAAAPGPRLPVLLSLVQNLAALYRVDTSRIYVTGFSMGASAATQAVLADPSMFAAVVAFSGIAPERSAAERLAGTPLLLVHGNADTENPIEPDRALYAALQRQPAAVVRFLEYQGMAHQVPADMLLATIWRDWLFAQHRR